MVPSAKLPAVSVIKKKFEQRCMVFAGLRRFFGKQEVPKKEESVADGHPYRTVAIVPRREVREKLFTGNSLDAALEECENEGYRALFMPEVARRRIA